MLEDMYPGASVPAGLPTPLPSQWEKTATPSDPSTAAFFRLYALVTDGIDNHAHSRLWTPFEAMFFDCAVAGFFEEYQAWKNNAHAYLNLFEDTLFLALRTVGHAYLHVAYDLPRVLVKDMDATVAMERAVGVHAIPWIPNGDVRLRFVDLQQVMTEALDQAQRDPAIFGALAYALRLLPGRSRFVQVFGNWMLALRSNAFLYAESMARYQPNSRPADGIRFQQIYSAAHAVVTKHRKNPLAWFGPDGFKTWWIGAMLPIALFAQVQPISPTALASPLGQTALIVAIAAAGVGSVWALDRWLAFLAGELGESILAALRRGTDNDDTRHRELAGA